MLRIGRTYDVKRLTKKRMLKIVRQVRRIAFGLPEEEGAKIGSIRPVHKGSRKRFW